MSKAVAVDWATAVKVAIKAAPTGPSVGGLEAAVAVADLRQYAVDAELTVRRVTNLGHELPVLAGVVVDRPGWIRATAEGMAILTEPITDRLSAELAANAELAGTADGAPKHRARRAPTLINPGAAAAAPIGTVLGYLSGKVLGQFDPFGSDPTDPHLQGKLLLVAPNIIMVERQLKVAPKDFRMWVCLHESTHRLQFSAVPWLRDHFRGLVAQFAEESELDPTVIADRIKAVWKSRRDSTPERPVSWVEASQTPDQLAVFHRLLAMMTLLEGHADYVMDAVGPQVIPSVAEIRSRFTVRRKKGGGPIDRLIRSLLGMDLKLRQYVQGGAFVHAVVDQVGMDRFNAIWTSPETLPTRAEILDPAAWVARVAP